MEHWIAERLLIGSLQGAVIIGIVWLACRRITGIPASVQAALWWLAALKLVLAITPIPAVLLPLLSPPVLPALPAPDLAVPDLVLPATAPAAAWSWLSVMVALWIAVVSAQAIHLAQAFRALRGVVRRATPLPSDDAATVHQLALAVGLRRSPDVRSSDEIAVPLVAGVWRPVVILPAALPRDDRPMAICHELMHVRRHDLALGWVPALAERLFFFHPFARLAAREYGTAREAACDAGVVRALGVAPDDYGRLLIRLGIARSQPAFAAGGAPASLSSLRRRLDMLQHTGSTPTRRRLTWTVGALMLLAIVPFELSARTPDAAPEPVAQAAPAAKPEPTPGTAERAVPEPAPQASPREEPAQRTEPLTDEQLLRRFRERQSETALRAAQSATGGMSALQRAVLDEMRYLDEQMRHQRAVGAAIDEKTIREYNALAEQANRLAQAYEEQRAAAGQRREADALARVQGDELALQIERLRVQQDQLLRQLRLLAEQQQRLTETQIRLLEEADRIRAALQEK